jgi:CubicO group peptidase (beta-lactamase class C family)
MDSVLLAQAIDYLGGQRDLYNIHSIAIVRHRHLVAEATYWPSKPDQIHHVASITKVFMSALIGIAIDQGYIAGVDEPVISFFPDRTIANCDQWKEAMTIEHLLTMTSGLGGVLDYEAEEAAMMASPDWVQFSLDLPMTTEPGTVWRYSDPNALLLSAIISATTGVSAHEFAKEHLFEPIGITRSIWWPPSPQGITDGSGGLMLAPLDLARFGQLFLQEGAWDGRQVISQSWVATSTSVHVGGFYCYLWGTYGDLPGLYFGSGSQGQRLAVSPSDDLVVAFNGGGYFNDDVETVYLEALRSYILPAVVSDQPLPSNPDGVGELERVVASVGRPAQVPVPVPPFPPIAASVSGQTYLLDANPLEMQSVVLTFPGEHEARLRVTSSGYWTYDRDFQWAVGLDNIERHAPGRLGILAAGRGEWMDGHTLLIDVDELGNLELHRVTLAFLGGGEEISVKIEDPYPWHPDPTLILTGRIPVGHRE